jgi:hypothetical protein
MGTKNRKIIPLIWRSLSAGFHHHKGVHNIVIPGVDKKFGDQTNAGLSSKPVPNAILFFQLVIPQ